MATIEQAGTMTGAAPGILDKERTIAVTGFNRWLVPPAALCIHLCIGMAYGFSVFWLPLSRAIPNAPTCANLGQELFSASCNWRVASLGWMYTLFFVLLGIAAAVWGGWLEREGPRKAGFVSASFSPRSQPSLSSRVKFIPATATARATACKPK